MVLSEDFFLRVALISGIVDYLNIFRYILVSERQGRGWGLGAVLSVKCIVYSVNEFS